MSSLRQADLRLVRAVAQRRGARVSAPGRWLAGCRAASSRPQRPSPSAATRGAARPEAASQGGPSAPTLTGGHTSPPAPALPPRILIYHAGTARIVWVATWKVASVVVLAFTALVVAPALYAAPEIRFPLPWAEEEPPPPPDAPAAGPAPLDRPAARAALAAAIVAGGCVPVYWALASARPFVAYIHLQLPPAARRSRPALRAWAAGIPAATRVDVTSLRALGNARQTRAVVAELSAAVPRAAAAAAAAPAAAAAGPGPPGKRAPKAFRAQPRDGPRPPRAGDVRIALRRTRLPGWQPPDDAARPWWRGRELTRFVVTAGRNRAAEPEVWDAFLDRIAGGEGAGKAQKDGGGDR